MIIGLTGGIATGKSEFASYLEEYGWRVIDADRIASELSKELEVQRRLKEAFGSEVISSGGSLNRRYLSRLVFFDAEKRRRLNQIFFPRIRTKLEEILKLRGEKEVIVLVAPLLYEAGLESLVDLVVWVEAPLQIRLERLEKMGLSFSEALARIRAGATRHFFQKPGDYLIFNDGRKETLREKAKLFYQEVTQELLEKESLGHA